MDPIPTVTPSQAAAAVRLASEDTRAIKDAGRIPQGTLYAALMTLGMDLPAFNRLVDLIVGTGLVRREGHELVWVGPAD